MKKIVLSIATLAVFAFSTSSVNAQYASPQAVSGTNPRPQAVSGTNPRPQVVSSPFGSIGVFFSTMMSMLGM